MTAHQLNLLIKIIHLRCQRNLLNSMNLVIPPIIYALSRVKNANARGVAEA